MNTNNVEGMIDKITELAKAEINSVTPPSQGGSIPYVIVPDGRKIESLKRILDDYAVKPDRRVGTDKVQDLVSLQEWTNRHKDVGTVLFCDTTRETPKLLTIVDYHQPVNQTGADDKPVTVDGDATARFAKFRALYDFPLSEQWKAWREIDGKVMDQGDFAAFLEDRVLDLIAPDVSQDGDGVEAIKLPPQVAELLVRLGGKCAFPNDIVTLSRGLDVTSNARTVQRVDMQTGEGSLVFDDKHEGTAGTKLTIPRLFMICIPLFDKSPFHYRIPVRIRYRLGGGIKWTLTLFGADVVIDMAIKEAAESVKKDTSVPLFYGTPA